MVLPPPSLMLGILIWVTSTLTGIWAVIYAMFSKRPEKSAWFAPVWSGLIGSLLIGWNATPAVEATILAAAIPSCLGLFAYWVLARRKWERDQ